MRRLVSGPARASYLFMLGLLVTVIALHLAMPLLAALFTYLALTRLCFVRRGGKWLAVGILLVLVAAVSYGLAYFIKQTVSALPLIADKAIPSIIQWAKGYHIELPFTDFDSLRDTAVEMVRSQARYLGDFAKVAGGAATQILLLLGGVVVAIGLFLNPSFELSSRTPARPNNLYSLCCRELAKRFGLFYRSFVTVMGAQIIISAINAALTAGFVAATHLPYLVVIVGVTFLCGLLPVVGNLISNTIVVGIGFTVSPKMALAALIFLVVIHKLEYLLNSKIVGWRIRNPLWLTLLGLIVGEKLMGIPGMILAPVVLNYLRLEGSAIELPVEEKAVAERAVVDS